MEAAYAVHDIGFTLVGNYGNKTGLKALTAAKDTTDWFLLQSDAIDQLLLEYRRSQLVLLGSPGA